MATRLHSQLPVVVTAAVVCAVFAAGPTVAQAAYDAVNADKVDGRHAVSAGADVATRAGKLVATNAKGRLPNNVIVKAPDADRLDGLDSTAFARAATTQLFNDRFVLAPGASFTELLSIPGLGTFKATCTDTGVFVQYFSPSGYSVDYWKTSASVNSGTVLAPGSGVVVTTRDEPAATIGLGTGNTSTDRRSATVHVFSLQQGDNAPCGFQVDATSSTSCPNGPSPRPPQRRTRYGRRAMGARLSR